MAELSDILRDAIKLEQEGERYYEMAAANTLNALARSTFRALAERERRHAELLRAYCDAVAQGGQCPTPEQIDAAPYSLGDTAKEIFDRARDELGSGSILPEDLDELYEGAIELERKSIELYEQQAEAADVEEHEEFLRYLVDQEKGHLRLLSEGQQYLTDPESWYFEEEQWSVTG